MKIRNTSMKLITAACALIALVATWGDVRVGAFAVGTPNTDLDAFALNVDKTLQGKINGLGWSPGLAGYNIVRVFNNSLNQKTLFALNGNTGGYQAFALNADGGIGSSKSSGNAQKELRCTNAELVKIGDTAKLITQDSFTGIIRTLPVNDLGVPDLNSMTKTFLADMEDKNLFSVYESPSASYQMIGVNTWTGEMATYSLNMLKVVTATWTRGWTSIDHLRIGDVTYRLLYKASGDPYKKPGESGDEARRFMIETVAPDGDTQSIYNHQLGANMGDFSSVRFIKFPDVLVRGGYLSSYGILFYRRTDGGYFLYQFDQQTGLGNLLDSRTLIESAILGVGALTTPYIDVAPYVINGKTCLAFLNADNAKPLSYEQAEQMGHVVHQTMKNSAVGYQFMLAQSGRIFFSRASGKLKLDSDPALERDMTSRTQLNIGSVSKMVTAMTLLKLAEQGKLNLSDNIIARIPSGQANSDSWAWETSVRNLLTHTSGVKDDLCTADDSALTVNCQSFFNAPHAPNDPGDPDDPNDDFKCVKNGKWNCTRSYNNSNIIAVRKVIEKVASTPESPVVTSKDIVALTYKLWAKDADLNEMTCAVNPNAYYYGPCNGGGDCFNFIGKSWRRRQESNSYSAYCSSGGWHASSRELIEFLGAIRYNKALKDTTLVNTLLDTTLADVSGKPGSTALSWEPPWSADGENLLGKHGDLDWDGVEVHAYITRLPNNSDAVLQINSDSAASLSSLLKDAYNNGVLGQAVVDRNGDYIYPYGYDVVTSTAINTAQTGATESKHVVVSRYGGNLKLRAFRASRMIDASQLELVDEKTVNFVSPGLSTDNVAVTDGANFATASLAKFAPGNLLNITTWDFNGSQLNKHASTYGSLTLGDEVAIAKIASAGMTTRIVTAVKNLDGKLQLDVWDCGYVLGLPDASTITHKGKIVDNQSPGATSFDIKNLGAVGDFTKPARFVTAYRAADGTLTVKTWQVDVNGSPQFLDAEAFTAALVPGANLVSSSDTLVHRVAIDAAGDGVSGFFNGHGFMTTFIAESLLLNVVTWSVDDAGKITYKGNKQTGGGVIGQALTATTTVVMLAGDPNQIKIIKWAVANDGTTITRPWTPTPGEPIPGIRATHVAATGNLVAAFVQLTPPFTLRVLNYVVLDPQ